MKNQIYYFLALAIPLMLLGAGCIPQNDTGQVMGSNTTTDSSDTLGLTAEVEPGVELVDTPSGKIPTSTLSYNAALHLYQSLGARIQFANCSGNPGTMALKTKTKFMIDNRDNAEHQIGIGSRFYLLPGYSFAIVSVQKAGDYNITCDGGGSAHVNVQN